MNHPSGRELDERPPDELILLKKMLVGIGEDVVQPKAALDAEGYAEKAQIYSFVMIEL